MGEEASVLECTSLTYLRRPLMNKRDLDIVNKMDVKRMLVELITNKTNSWTTLRHSYSYFDHIDTIITRYHLNFKHNFNLMHDHFGALMRLSQ